MATRPDPYVPKIPGDIIRAGDWNEVQVQSREELGSKLAAHGHSGGGDASPIARAGIAPNAVDGTRIDPQSDVALKSLKVNGRTLLDEIDALVARFNVLNANPLLLQKDLQVGGPTRLNAQVDIAGPLSVNGGATIKGAFSFRTFSSDDRDEPGLFIWSQDYGKSWDEQVLKHSAARGMFGRAGFGIHMDATREWGIWSSGWTALLAVEGGTGRVKTRGDLKVGGALAWGNSQLLAEQGGSIELGGSNSVAGTGTPFIDFHFSGKQEDFNVRLINDADTRLSVVGDLNVSGQINAGNSDLYFFRTDHDCTGKGNPPGFAAIENASNYDALMLLGRANAVHPIRPNVRSRVVKLWDVLEVVGDLRVDGALQPSAGNSENNGLMFPKDPGGGGGDAAWLRYYARSGESCTLELGISNDGDDFILLNASGGVRITGDLTTRAIWNQLGALAYSDATLKHSISTIGQALDKVKALRGVTFRWNEAAELGDQAGMVAQEVEAVFAPVVATHSDGKKAINYNGMIGLLVEAIKEQQILIDALRVGTRIA